MPLVVHRRKEKEEEKSEFEKNYYGADSFLCVRLCVLPFARESSETVKSHRRQTWHGVMRMQSRFNYIDLNKCS